MPEGKQQQYPKPVLSAWDAMHRNEENPLKEALLVKEEGIWMTAFSLFTQCFLPRYYSKG